MPLFYIDSSALVKRYCSEPGSEFVNTLFEFLRSQKEFLFTSCLSTVEFCSAVMRLSRENKITEKEKLELINEFRIESQLMFKYVYVEKLILSMAIKLLLDHPLRAYDAIQLASGLEVMNHASEEARVFYFVCDDERLCQAAESESLKVLRPRSSAAHDELMRLRMA